jgi:hypothetical protein
MRLTPREETPACAAKCSLVNCLNSRSITKDYPIVFLRDQSVPTYLQGLCSRSLRRPQGAPRA